MSSMRQLRLLEDDKYFNKAKAIQELQISPNTFYKYYIHRMKMEPDDSIGAIGSNRFLYKGSTINAITINLVENKTTPFYMEENVKN